MLGGVVDDASVLFPSSNRSLAVSVADFVVFKKICHSKNQNLNILFITVKRVPWTDPRGVAVFETDDELRDALWVLAKHEFGGNPTNKVDWIKKGWDKNKDQEK